MDDVVKKESAIKSFFSRTLPWWISYISNAIAELGQRLYSVSCKATSHAANHKQFENPSDDLNTFFSRWISCEEEAR